VTRSLRVAALVLAIAAAAPAATPAEGSQAASVRVYFLQGEQLVAVTRPGSTVKAAVTALLAGPARAETAKQFPTYVPSGTRLRSVRFANGVATVDLGERFAAGRDAESLSARITQLVYTVASVPGVKSVRLLVSGGVPLGLFPGYALSRPVTRAQATRPIVPPPTAPPGEGGQPNPETRALQQRLADLGFLALSAVDGVAGEQTRFAVIAFQKWARLARDGVAGPQTRAALAQAGRPSPLRSGGGGRRVEVLLDRQLALAIENNTVVRAIHVSTGRRATGHRRARTPCSGRRCGRGQCRSRSGCRGRATSSAASPSTSIRTSPSSRPRTVHQDAPLRRQVAVRLHADRDAGHDPLPLVRVLLATVIALALVGGASGAAPPATVAPGVLTVALNLPSAGFQAGAVRPNKTVVAARGSRSTSPGRWPRGSVSSAFGS
jgi:hypothetical protein